MRQHKPLSRERIAGIIIYFCLALMILSIILIKVMDVRVVNVEAVDRGLYTVITQNGPVNVTSDDVLRIERTYTKAAISGSTVELDKIYTKKGFIYAASTDSFYEPTSQLINSVDFLGLATWERDNVTWQSVQPYGYAIGTPANHISFLFFLLSLQYFLLSVGGLTLAVLIFPLRWKEVVEEDEEKIIPQPNKSNEDYLAEEQLSAVAK
ncbi:hypothetical protein ACHOLT_13810 [Desulfitobacterium sp. Sab5]|uniref:hypothetical protein n=1 Tax=Desulfitobacterium nosdiversum TaxID=3375356 RepID=UPI003CF1028D